MDVTAIKLLKGDRMFQLLKHKIKKSKRVVDVLERKNPKLSTNKTIQATTISPLMHMKHASLQFS